MEVYVDDMLVKSHVSGNQVDDLEEAFTTLHKYQIKLNPAKHVFGVTSSMFFGFMVLH